MQGVDHAVGRDRTAGRHERLSRDLTAENPLNPLLRAASPEDIELDLLQVEQVEQLLESRVHGASNKNAPGEYYSSVTLVRLPPSVATRHSSSTASPYRSSLTRPMPAMASSSASVVGTRSAIA